MNAKRRLGLSNKEGTMKAMKKTVLCLLLAVLTLTGCQDPAGESRSWEESVPQGESVSQESVAPQESVSQESVAPQEIEIVKTQDCDIAWEQIEFALDIDALGIGDIVGKISSDGQAKEMARAIIERRHEKGKIPDYELVYIEHYTQDNFWFFVYSIDQRNTAPEDLIDCGGFYVVIDGDGGTVIEAWVDE